MNPPSVFFAAVLRIARFAGMGFALALATGVCRAELKKLMELPLNAPRSGCAVVITNEAAFIIGGWGSGGPVGSIERLDFATNKATKLPTEMTPRQGPGAAEIDGKIYVVGGLGNDFNRVLPLPTVEVIDVATGKISRVANLPTPRANLGVVAYKKKLYAIGGTRLKNKDRTQTNIVEIYDPATDTWTAGVPMPTPRETCAVVVDDLIVVPGGYAGKSALATVEMFVPTENVWKKLPPLDRPVSDHSAALMNDSLYLFGDFSAPSQVLAYNLRTRKTSVVKPGYSPARRNGASSLGPMVIVAGGVDEGRSELSIVQVLVDTLEKP